MAELNVRVPVDTLVKFMVATLEKMGVPGDDAAIIADVLITSDLWGVRSHGVAHLKMYHERIKRGLQLPVSNWKVVKDSKATAVIDGGNGMGMVVGYHAMKLAIEKARAVGVGKLLGWSLAAGGEAGVKRMLELMDVEVRTAMGLMGVTSLAQLNPSWVRPAQPTGPAGVTSAYPWFEEKK